MSDERWQAVAALGDIADGGYLVVAVDQQSILLTRFQDEVFAIENVCSHAQSALAGGRLRNGRISCPLHGAMFDARTGAAIGGGLAPCGVRTFAARLVEGQIQVLPSAHPALPR